MKNPFGLNTITPYLIVTDVARQLEFIRKVLDGKVRGEVVYRDDGTVKHAEVLIGESVVMMGEPTGEIKQMPATLYTYVSDCDETYRKAVQYGAKSILPPDNYPHGDRYGGVQDANGNIWWVVTHIGKDKVNR